MVLSNVARTGPTIRRLTGVPGGLAVFAAGRLARREPASVLVFDAGADIHRLDLVARFFVQEMAALDWLDDFLRNPEMEEMVREPEMLEGEDEVLDDNEYRRSELTTLGSEVMDDSGP